MVHNLSDKELSVHQVDLLEIDAGFNTIDAKPIDFIGALVLESKWVTNHVERFGNC